MTQPERCPAVSADNNGVRYQCRRVKDHALSPAKHYLENGIMAPVEIRAVQYHVSDPLEHDDGQTCTILKWEATLESMGRE